MASNHCSSLGPRSHWNIEWVGKDLKIIRFHRPYHGQGHLPLDQVDQSPIQAGLDSVLLTSRDIVSVTLQNLPLQIRKLVQGAIEGEIECLIVYIKKQQQQKNYLKDGSSITINILRERKY